MNFRRGKTLKRRSNLVGTWGVASLGRHICQRSFRWTLLLGYWEDKVRLGEVRGVKRDISKGISGRSVALVVS